MFKIEKRKTKNEIKINFLLFSNSTAPLIGAVVFAAIVVVVIVIVAVAVAVAVAVPVSVAVSVAVVVIVVVVVVGSGIIPAAVNWLRTSLAVSFELHMGLLHVYVIVAPGVSKSDVLIFWAIKPYDGVISLNFMQDERLAKPLPSITDRQKPSLQGIDAPLVSAHVKVVFDPFSYKRLAKLFWINV